MKKETCAGLSTELKKKYYFIQQFRKSISFYRDVRIHTYEFKLSLSLCLLPLSLSPSLPLSSTPCFCALSASYLNPCVSHDTLVFVWTCQCLQTSSSPVSAARWSTPSPPSPSSLVDANSVLRKGVRNMRCRDTGWPRGRKRVRRIKRERLNVRIECKFCRGGEGCLDGRTRRRMDGELDGWWD